MFLRIDVVLKRRGNAQISIDQQQQYEILKEIQDIIQQERIIPYFQPIYNLKNQQVFGVEMLSRPQTQTRLSNPEVLFKEALRLGLYVQVEMMIWQKAMDIFRKYANQYGCHMFLNCNPYLVEHNQYALVKSMFQSTGVSPSRIYLELTERSAIGEFSMFYEKLNQYREGGFSIAVDDVGGGYSSLETIVHTRPQAVKIDRHITTDVSNDLIKQSIIKLLVAFCHENNIVSIAEGIETKQDLDTVIQLGVDAGQGYYLCRPKEKLMECFQ